MWLDKNAKRKRELQGWKNEYKDVLSLDNYDEGKLGGHHEVKRPTNTPRERHKRKNEKEYISRGLTKYEEFKCAK